MTCCTSPRPGELPGVARLVERGLALRGGAVAEFPSVTLTNHTSILTGVGPGRHGVLGNVYYDRAPGERVVPNDAETLAPQRGVAAARRADGLRDGERPCGSKAIRHAPQASTRRSTAVPTTGRWRCCGRPGVSRPATNGMGDLLPDPDESPFVQRPEHLEDAYFRWGVQVDDLGLQQMLQLWETADDAPTLTWWAHVVTDAGHHGGGPRSEMARDSLRQSDARLVAFLDHLEGLGVLDEVTFLLTADHGFEGADPSVTGSWKPALEALGIPYRDEGPGFIYLL